mgnify:CR=1 FL=1
MKLFRVAFFRIDFFQNPYFSRYLWRGSANFKINSRSLSTIILKLKSDKFNTRDFSPLIERVLEGVILILKLTCEFDFIISSICRISQIRSVITFSRHNHNYQPGKDLLLYWFFFMLYRIWQIQIQFARQYNTLLIRNCSRILTTHKDRSFWKKNSLKTKKWSSKMG